LNTHVKLMHGTETYACHVCTFRTKSSKYLKKHVATQHAPQRHACTVCNASCASRTELSVHRAAAHPELAAAALLACPDCDYRTGRRFNLDKHVRGVHRRGPGHVCPRCDAVFRHPGSLRQHEQSAHVGALYACRQCEKVYHHRGTLSKHENSVHGEATRIRDEPKDRPSSKVVRESY
jgi:KRAB domain-containing zinc finger protein